MEFNFSPPDMPPDGSHLVGGAWSMRIVVHAAWSMEDGLKGQGHVEDGHKGQGHVGVVRVVAVVRGAASARNDQCILYRL